MREDGFTLVEMMMAIAVMAIMFMATALVLGATIGGAAETRLKQHSVETATEILEGTRAIDYATVATQNIGADISQLLGEGYIVDDPDDLPMPYTFDPDGSSGPLPAEGIVMTTSSAIDPVQVLQRNGALFTVRTIVTDPDTTATPYKRVTTQVSWVQDGQTFRRQITTIVSETRRGLPLPNFQVGDDATFSYPLGGKMHLPFQITNNGARDSWNITAVASPTRTWTDPAPQSPRITWYRDSDGSGTYSAIGGDTELTDTSGDGPVDTGLMETDEPRKIVGYIDLASVPAEPAGTVVVTITITSESQPLSNPKTVELTLNLAGPAGCVGGCTLTPYYFHNQYPGTGATTLISGDMPANTTIPTQTTLPNYDTNQDAVPGRTILQGTGNYSEATATKIAKWSYQMPGATLVKGSNNVTLRVWVKTSNGVPGTTIVVNGYARYTTTGSASSHVPLGAGSGAATLAFPIGTEWLLAQIPIAVSADTTIGNNRFLKAYLTISDALSTDDAIIAYDTATTVFAPEPNIEIPKG